MRKRFVVQAVAKDDRTRTDIKKFRKIGSAQRFVEHAVADYGDILSITGTRFVVIDLVA